MSKRPMDGMEAIFYHGQGCLHVVIQLNDKDDVIRFVEYAKENVVQLRVNFTVENNVPYVVMHDSLCLDNVHVHEEPVSNEFFKADRISQNLKPQSPDVAVELHAFPNVARVLLIASHSVMDGRRCIAVYQAYREGRQLPRGQVASSVSLLRKDIECYSAPCQTLENKFEFVEPEQEDVGSVYNIRLVQADTTSMPHLMQRFSQRMILISSLLKLRMLQEQGALTAGQITQYLSEGLVMYQDLIVDLGSIINPSELGNQVFGNTVSSYAFRFVLNGDKTVGEYTVELTDEIKRLEQQKQYVQFYINLEKHSAIGAAAQTKRVINSFQFSSVGRIPENMIITPWMHKQKSQTHYCSVVMTAGTKLYCYMQHPGWMRPYIENMEKWLLTLFNGIKNEVTIEQLFKSIQ